LLGLKKNLKDEKYKVCPLCGSKIDFIVEKHRLKERYDLHSINEDNWLLP